MWVINRKYGVEPDSDVLSGCLKCSGVTFLRGIKLSTMTTVSTLGSPGNLGELRAGFSLGCPLPWVFAAVRKEGVCACDIETSLVGG